MSDYKDMTDNDKVIAVLTAVCGWRWDRALLWWAKPCGGNCYEGYEPPILTSADAAIEYVGKSIDERKLVWTYHSEDGCEVGGKYLGYGDLAHALCEAAYKMVTEGEEG